MADDDRSTLGPTEKLYAPPPLGKRHCLMVHLAGRMQTIALPASGSVIIGRAREAAVRIDAQTVSRKHARLSIAPGMVTVADLGSQNGTRLNGERLTAERPLAYGDILSLGEVTAVFGCDGGGSASPSGDAAAGSRTLTFGATSVLLADPAMIHAYTQIERLAPTELSLLVTGETGTGKDLAASALHHWSRRRGKPLVAINCAALPDNLAESELFGYERGAFSGAVGSKPGLLESAAGGTVFLDEIGDLSLAIQAKLLRAIEARRVTRLGSVQEKPIDVRIVAATHRDLDASVHGGRFRRDLYYRLSVAVVSLAPLRDRPREIELLARRFLEAACKAHGRPPIALADEAVGRLRAHPWPGNVRELKNVIEYLAATTVGGVLGADAVAQRLGPSQRPAAAAAPAAVVTSGGPPAKTLAEASSDFERDAIRDALGAAGGNKTRAAKLLGIPLRTFMTKVKRHGL